MIVHLLDGTYELFRHFYGLRHFTKGKDPPYGAVLGVLRTVLQMVEAGATHLVELALLFKRLATLRTDAPLFEDVAALRWRGPIEDFAAWTERMQDARLLERSLKARHAS